MQVYINLVFTHVIALIIGAVIGLIITCCIVVSGRADKQLGIEDEVTEE